ncbi:MAG: hypothetical protein RBR06_02235 [Desulfuromonadaceae bacterium]|nr:hypothetical protein [Desulfuromonadaceae bacterium]
MRSLAVFSVFTFFIVSWLPKQGLAEDAWEYFSVQDALNSPLAQEKLESGIEFYMKGQPHAKVDNITREYTANKRSRKFGRSTEEACQTAFISALMSFQDRAHKEGCDTVVDLYSITKDKEFESIDQYSCLVGGMVANVALRGKVGKR